MKPGSHGLVAAEGQVPCKQRVREVKKQQSEEKHMQCADQNDRPQL